MTALPADIARFTTDGVVVTAPTSQAVTDAIKADHIDARTTSEIEMFYDNPSDAQWALDERFSYLRKVNPVHLAIETEEAIGLGTTIDLSPSVPCYNAVDPYLEVAALVRVRAYSYVLATDRFAVEVME